MANANTTQATPNRGGARLPPALNPEVPALTQPYRDFVARGWISKLTLEITPGTTAIHVTLGGSVDIKDGESRENITPNMAKDLIIRSGLWSPNQRGTGGQVKKKNVSAQLPLRSLCKSDFEGTEANLLNRIRSVAKNVGDNTARGRIGSLKMFIDGVNTFEKWWKMAAPVAIAKLLTSKTYYESIGADQFKRIKEVCPECPFRGDVPTQSSQNEDVAGPSGATASEDEEEEPPRQPTPRVSAGTEGGSKAPSPKPQKGKGKAPSPRK